MIFLRKTFVVLIAILLLISSSGVFVMIHKCMSSKKSEITFTDEHKCCGTKKQNKKSCNVERKCCFVDYQYHKLNAVSLTSEENPTPDIILSESTLFDFNNKPFPIALLTVQNSPPLVFHNISVEFHQLLI